VLCCATTAEAGEERLESATLSYVVSGAALRCPDEESFRRKVAARLGYQPFSTGGLHRVSVRLSATSTGLRGHAEVTRVGQSESGVRDLDGAVDECEPVTAALAVAVAIALDPVRSAQASEPPIDPHAQDVEPAPAPLTPAVVAAPAPAALPAADAVEPPAASRITLFGAAGAVAGVGLTPGASAGGTIGVGLRRRALSVELSGRAEATPGPTRVDAGDRLEANAFSALLATCAHLRRASACGLGRIGVMQGMALDVKDPMLRTSTFGTLGARAGYEVALSTAVALRGLLSAELPLVRTSFVIDGRSVWTAPPVLGGIEIGVVVAVP
jgi:hypothetical protein